MKRFWLLTLGFAAACATAGEDADSGPINNHRIDAGRVFTFIDASVDAPSKPPPVDSGPIDADTTPDVFIKPDSSPPPDAMAGTPDARPCTQMQIQLLANPSFDSGSSGWTQDSEWGNTLIIQAPNGVTPPSAPNLGALDGSNFDDDVLSQSVTVPADATALSISGYVGIGTYESGGVYDTLTLKIAGTTVHRWSNADVQNNFFTFSYPVSTHAGQTVSVSFEGVTDYSNATIFYLDSLQLNATVCR